MSDKTFYSYYDERFNKEEKIIIEMYLDSDEGRKYKKCDKNNTVLLDHFRYKIESYYKNIEEIVKKSELLKIKQEQNKIKQEQKNEQIQKELEIIKPKILKYSKIILGTFYAESLFSESKINSHLYTLRSLFSLVSKYHVILNGKNFDKWYSKNNVRKIRFTIDEDYRQKYQDTGYADILECREYAISSIEMIGRRYSKKSSPNHQDVKKRIFKICSCCGMLPSVEKKYVDTNIFAVICKCGKWTNYGGFKEVIRRWNNGKLKDAHDNICKNIGLEFIVDEFDYDTFTPEPDEKFAMIASSKPIDKTAILVTSSSWESNLSDRIRFISEK